MTGLTTYFSGLITYPDVFQTLIFTRGQFWPSGIVIAPVCVSVSVCVCVSITCLSAR